MSLSADELAALLALPALAAPAGTTANFDNPPNQNGLAWFVTTFCMVVSTLCLFIRLYAKVWMTKKPGIEEVLMLLGYGAFWATAYAAYGMIYVPGYYVHTWNLRNGDLVKPLWLILIYGCAYSAVLPLLKSAILIDWCRIFVPSNRYKNAFWWGCTAVIALQVVWGALCILLLNLQCRPHAAIWEFYLPSKCYPAKYIMLTSACVQVFSDWTMVLLPQKIIWTLNMNWQKKVGISILFGVGLLASISACFRLATTVTFAREADTMYFIGPLLFWACSEMTCGFFILCVPCLATVIRGFKTTFPVWFTKALGLSTTDASNTDGFSHNKTLSKSKMTSSKAGRSTTDAYYKMDEEDGAVSLGDLSTSESQENLRTKGALKVTRTTQVTVTSDSRSAESILGPGETSMSWLKS